jgi:hypothetical protein
LKLRIRNLSAQFAEARLIPPIGTARFVIWVWYCAIIFEVRSAVS